MIIYRQFQVSLIDTTFKTLKKRQASGPQQISDDDAQHCRQEETDSPFFGLRLEEDITEEAAADYS